MLPVRALDSDLALAPSTGAERAAAAIAHSAVFLGMPFLLPLAIWALFPMVNPQSAYVRHQAVQAMLFHLVVLAIGTVLGVLVASTMFASFLLAYQLERITVWLQSAWPLLLGIGVTAAVALVWTVVVMLIATWKAALGEPYRMPLVGGAAGRF